MKKLYPYAISIDWLQLNCYAEMDLHEVIGKKTSSPRIEFSSGTTEPTFLYNRGFIAKDRGYGSKVFREVYEVEEIQKTESGAQRTEPFATIAFNPYAVRLCNKHQSSEDAGLNPRTCIVKIDNKVLYEKDLWARIFRFLDAFYLNFRGITRIDICYDCNYLMNGKSPQKLMNDFDAGKIRRSGARSYIAFKTQSAWIRNKVTRGDLDPTYFAGELHDEGTQNRVNSLTWGFRGRSSLQSQIYNKTEEIKAGRENNPNYKRHITELWESRGLDLSKNVYRFEVRISADSKELLDLNTRNYFKIGLDNLEFQESLEEVFACYANKAFCFFVPDFTKSHQERLPRLELFCCNMDVAMKCKHFKQETKHTRTLTILRNYLSKQIDQADESNDIEAEATRKAVYSVALRYLQQDLTATKVEEEAEARKEAESIKEIEFEKWKQVAYIRQSAPVEFASESDNAEAEARRRTSAYELPDAEEETKRVLQLERLTDCYGSDDVPF